MSMHRNRLIMLCLVAVSLTLAAPAFTAVLIDCSGGGDIIDRISRGFYISDYPGISLTGVDVWISSRGAGDHTLTMTARFNAYDGPVLGTHQLVVNLSGDQNDLVEVNFMFFPVSVTTGSIVTFAMEMSDGPEEPFYAVDTPNSECPLIQTHGTTPPLDSWRRDGVSARVHGTLATPTQPASWGAVKGSYH